MPKASPAPASTSPTTEMPTKPQPDKKLLPRQYKRILLKLSGESFSKPGTFGIDPEELEFIGGEVKGAATAGAQLAVVVGGGNIIRGAELASQGHIHQATADQMGMLGTVINALALKEKLITLQVPCRVMSAIEIRAVAEPFIRMRAIRHLEKGRVVILAAGTGNPYFSTDTCAALRATELECDILMKATKVDGVYTADPRKDPTATRYDTITFADAMRQRLRVMDIAALEMCDQHNVPVMVFDFKRRGNIARVARGEKIGTLLHSA